MYNSFGKYKTISHIQVLIGLCMAFCFILCSSNHITIALDDYDHNLYPIKSSRILSEDTTVSKDLGLEDCQFSLVSSNVSGGIKYVEYVLNMVDNALTHVNSYFTSEISLNYDKQFFTNLLLSADNGYFIDRDLFLNAYLAVDKNNIGRVFFSYNYNYMGFNGMPYSVDNLSSNTVAYYHWHGYSSLNFASGYENNSIEYDYISSCPGPDFSFSSLYNSNNLSYFGFTYLSSSDYITYFNDLFVNNNSTVDYFTKFSDGQVHLMSALRYKYILPLYIDADIYFPLSFNSPYNDSYTLHGDFTYASNYSSFFYTPALGNISGDYFNSNLWYAGEFQSGIKGTTYPDPIITPIPTFGPIYTPTSFPTINISATLTPIAIPNDPYISIGNADPISTVTGVISYLMTMFATPFFGFVKYTLQYIYNSSVYWQILMFLIPGVVLVAFLIGRLKRK